MCLNSFRVRKDIQAFSDEFLQAVKEICLLANKCGIPIYDGRASYPLTPENIAEWVTSRDIFINGDEKHYHQTLAIVLDSSYFKWEQTNYCETKKYPYDVVVKLILQLAYNYGYLIRKPIQDEANLNWFSQGMWASVKKILKHTTKSSISLQEFKDFWEYKK